jgi:hypothetical protein
VNEVLRKASLKRIGLERGVAQRAARLLARGLLAPVPPLLLAASALAQFEASSVLGTVRDSNRAVIAGATVTLANAETGISATATTDAEGNYEFYGVRIGRYRLTVRKQAFSTTTAGGVTVGIGARQRADLTLAVGQARETVQVTGDASLLDTDSSQRGQTISRRQAAELPLNGREYSALVPLTTGARLSMGTTGQPNTPREGSFNVNGLPSTMNNFLLDGTDNNSYGTSNQGFSNQVMQPPPDAVAEFKVVTNNTSAEYGRSAGATINVAYRSGSNKLEGSIWEFYRDTDLNATGFFKPVDGRKPPLRRNQFGFALGGSIRADKAFFFVDYEGLRQSRKQVAFATVPGVAQRQGILTVPVHHPITGAQYPAGVPIPMTSFASRVLSDLPPPNRPGAANNYQTLQELGNVSDKYDVKLDAQLSPRLRVFARFGQRDADLTEQPLLPLPSGGGGSGSQYVRNKQFALGMTFVPSDTSLWELRFVYSRAQGGKRPPALGGPSAQEAYGISGLPTDPRVAGGLPTQFITGYSDLGRQSTNPQWQFPTVFAPKLNYSRRLGRHSLKAGLEWQSVRTEVQDVSPLYGSDEYAGRFTRPLGSTSADNQYSLADFMLGLRSRYSLSNLLVANVRQDLCFAYLQDDFRLSRSLTLNLGVRYEYGTPQWEADDALTNFDPVSRTMIAARGGSIYDRALVDPDRNNVAPRLGFAWSITNKTVVRGGYGTSFVHFQRAGSGNLLMINGPQVINAVVSQSNPTAPAFRLTEAGYPEDITDPSTFNPLLANVTYMPRDHQSAEVRSWFLAFQRELFRGAIVDVAYVENRGRNMLLFANYNQALPNDAQGSLPLATRRPIPGWGDITYAFDGGKSEYRALQLRLESRLKFGLVLLSAFTWSRALDNAAGPLEGANGDIPSPQDVHDLDADYSYSAYDQPYNSTTSLVWELPFGKGRRYMSDGSGVVEALLGGWQVSGIFRAWSGERLNLRYVPSAAFQVSGITQPFRGANAYRPDVIGDPLAPAGERSITNYFNKANVVLPTDPSQPFGDAKRNSVMGYPFYQVDLALAKSFLLPWHESRLQLRIEAFNLSNRTNFKGANSNRSSAEFGTITSTYDARQIQLGAKLLF